MIFFIEKNTFYVDANTFYSLISAIFLKTFLMLSFSDDARDIHGDEDLKRQRNQYNGDQIYSNVIQL